MADPWNGSRTLAALLGCLVLAGGAAVLREWFAADFALQDEIMQRYAAAQGVDYFPQDHSFYFQSLDLVNLAITVGLLIATGGLVVALTESVTSRRRAYAALVATGVGRGTLARAVLWQSMAPAALGVLLALAVGTGLAYGLFGTTVTDYDFSVCPTGDCEQPPIIRNVPFPLVDLALFGVGGLVALLAAVGVGLLFLRASTALEELRV
ncbi:FtsX-like permease family protein [Salinispora cortesiana]|uniref:FtsX-like permease family protein n=1 Tax=Salinispora cortesiana TaxID=1305843 RepID=UPI000423EC8E|nr:FtsX-like permease family protein [Salinispora cortesiana]